MLTRRISLIGAGCLGVVGAASFVVPQKLKASALPRVISEPGEYVIKSDYTAVNGDDSAIVVAQDVHDVTILLHGDLICPTDFPTARQNSGIFFAGNNNGCTVIGRGGRIRGFGFGINAPKSDGLRISNLNIESVLMRGIKIDGDDAVVRNCLIKNVFGSTYTPTQFCMGIEVSGGRPRIVNNIVEEFYGTGPEPDNGEAIGISVSDKGVDGVIMGNIVKNSRKQPKSYGYWIGGASDVSFVHNHVDNMSRGAAASSPTIGMEAENSYRNCDLNFYEFKHRWIVGNG